LREVNSPSFPNKRNKTSRKTELKMKRRRRMDLVGRRQSILPLVSKVKFKGEKAGQLTEYPNL
jgi:hypothetical protein